MNRLEAAVSNDDDEIGFEALTDLSRRMAEWSDRFTSPCDLSRGLRTLSEDWCGLAEQMRGQKPPHLQQHR